MSTLSTLLWTLGLALQTLLLVLLVKRGIARHRPLFTALLLFFCVRSVLLFTTSPHLSRAAFLDLSAALSLLDLLLQIALAFTLSLAIARSTRHSTSSSRLHAPILFGALLALSASLTAALVAVLPAHSPAPVDRAVTFTALLFLSLFAYTSARRLHAPDPTGPDRTSIDRTILSGLAAFSLAAIASQIGRCIAASHRDAHTFFAWTSVSLAAYLLVLLFWVLRCLPNTSPEPPPSKICAGPLQQDLRDRCHLPMAECTAWAIDVVGRPSKA